MANPAPDAPSPPVEDDQLINSGPEFSCLTQPNNLPVIATPPAHKSSQSHGERRLVVGSGPLIPRLAVPSGGLKLRWYVAESTFPTPADAAYANSELQKAAAEWGKVFTPVQFEATTDESLAHFRLCYQANAKSLITAFADWLGGTLMKGFQPHQQPSNDLWVLPITFTKDAKQDWKAIMHNLFLHEMGHIMGLRHEFAAEKESDVNPSVQFGARNPKSVMEYKMPPMLQQSDIDTLKEFYKLPNGSEIGGIKITDYTPTLRTKGGKPLTG
jgi:Met-zincin